MLAEKVLDTGTSVRKRAVRILKEICLRNPLHPKYTKLCIALMSRINDEQGIKNLVLNAFTEASDVSQHASPVLASLVSGFGICSEHLSLVLVF